MATSSSSGVHIDTTNFNRMVKKLARITPGVSLQRVLEHEVAAVMEKTISGTKTATVAKIRTAAEKRRAGRHDVGNGRKIYFYDNRYPDALWKRIAAQRKASLQRKLKARGLSKRSWMALAQAAGLKVTAPAFVGKATPSDGKNYDAVNYRTRRIRRGPRYGIWVSNAQPTVQTFNAGGRRALARAINGRVRYFETNLKKRVFEQVQTIARAYPGFR